MNVQHQTRIRGTELIEGHIVYVTGRWQRIGHVDHVSEDTVRFSTQRSGGQVGTARAQSMYDVAICPACRQAITAEDDYTECGGIGEGGCDGWIDGDPAAEAAHAWAAAIVARGVRA